MLFFKFSSDFLTVQIFLKFFFPDIIVGNYQGHAELKSVEIC